jgi:hypothetical protein
MEDGTLAETLPDPGAVDQAAVLRRTIKLTIPFLLMFGVGSLGLPWRQQGLRCALVVAAEALVILWFFRRTREMLSFQIPRPAAKQPVFLRNPVILLLLIAFGAALLGGLMVLFLHPGTMKAGLASPGLGSLGLGLLAAVLACAVPVALFLALRCPLGRLGSWLADKWDIPLLRPLRILLRGPGTFIAEQTYAPLCQQLDLGPDQRAQLTDLILKRTRDGVRAGMSLWSGKLDDVKRAALLRKMHSDSEAVNARIQELLGADHYAAFQQFEKTIPDRAMVDMFKRQTARTAAALGPEQAAQLLQALTEARAQNPGTTELSRRNPEVGDQPARLTPDNLAALVREREEFDRQFLLRAQALLSPEQLAAFAQSQARQRRMQKLHMEKFTQLFAPLPKP